MFALLNIVYLSQISLYLMYYIIKWSLFYFFALFAVICATNLWRFLAIKFGSRIKADGSKGILITGATSGFGLLMAKHFHRLGFSVFACYYNDREVGYGELLELGMRQDQAGKNSDANGKTNKSNLFLIRMDVSSRESIEQAHQEVETLLDKHNMELYCVVNNAGISKVGSFEWVDRESLRQSIDTNLTGALLVTRQFILRIIQSKGRIVNISSGMQAFSNGPGITVYGCTKTALRYFSDSLHEDIAMYGASCHCILPGNFITTSNILYSRLKSIQDSERKLTDLERSVFSQSISLNFQIVHKLLKSKLSKTKEDLKQIEESFNVKIPNLDNLEFKNGPHHFGLVAKFIQLFTQYFDGGADNLESSGVMEGFDQAVCLKDPPRNIYAGTPIYTYFTGPGMDHLSPMICRLMGKGVFLSLTES